MRTKKEKHSRLTQALLDTAKDMKNAGILKEKAHEKVKKRLGLPGVKESAYPFEIRSLTPEEGGGYLISYPDFNVCIADGETIEEAIADGEKALAAVIASLKVRGLPVPTPGSQSVGH